jgi:DNA-binding CsgD family transcriptional regulator
MDEHVISGLVGREREISALSARLRAIRQHGGAVVIRGPAGIGKSALLTAARDLADSEDVRVLTVSGSRSEAGLAFAGLHQMLRSLLDRAGRLPRPQRDALLAAFGVAEASASEAFLIAVATLELLAEDAERTPLLVAVEDAHWLDRPTADVLAFLARRLDAVPVVLLIAVRDGYDTTLVEAGLPELRIDALDKHSSGVLLDSCAPGLSPWLRGRVLAAAAGNPLALVELHAAAGMPGPPGLFGMPERLPMTARLEQTLVERVHDLPAATRTILLVAAADEQASLRDVLTAAAGASVGDLAPAVASGLVDHDHKRIRFRVPLLPAAIYQAATPMQRHRAHAALADVIDDPHRRAWHVAVTGTGPDEEAAAELEVVSSNAWASGRSGIALASAERAAELTPDASLRRRRALQAAEFATELGQCERASRLLGEIDSASCDSVERARFSLVRYRIDPAIPEAAASLVDGARQATSAGDIDLALRGLEAAAIHGWWADPGSEPRSRIVAATNRVPVPKDDLRVLSILGLCDPAGHGAMLRKTASGLALDGLDAKAAYSFAAALHATGDFEGSSRFLVAAISFLRKHDRFWLLAQALAQQAWTATHAGNWNLAVAAAEEAAILAGETHQPMWQAAAQTARALIAAIRGEDRSAESLLREAEGLALPLGANAVLADIQLARALVALGGGRYDEAFHCLRRTFDANDPAHHHFRSYWRIGEFAEAAVRIGHVEEAREQLARAEYLVRLNASPRLQVGLLHARPLLAVEAAAEAYFKAGLSANLTPWPLYRARLLLEYGTWLRRQRKISEARMPLRAARDTLEALDAIPWAERARQELRATREVQGQSSDSWYQLTEQEQQVACLAAQGLSNREIAQRLYISHRTVGSHLYHIFPKLGIASRAQLQAVIGKLQSEAWRPDAIRSAIQPTCSRSTDVIPDPISTS